MKKLTFIMIQYIANYQILLYFTSLTGNEVWMTISYLASGSWSLYFLVFNLWGKKVCMNLVWEIYTFLCMKKEQGFNCYLKEYNLIYKCITPFRM